MDAKSEILSRIRTALGPDRTPVDVPRTYTRTTPETDDIPTLFATRAADYQARVRRVTAQPTLAGPGGPTALIPFDPVPVAAAITDLLKTTHVRSLVVPADFPEALLPQDNYVIRRDDPPLPVADLDTTDAVLTGCAAAIAETGTIILNAGPLQGRRALTLIPDTHLCLVRADQIVGTVPEALSTVDATAPLTWISGPSATSDIELHRVEGVHGPRTLLILIID
ncbi:LUD domain-containing protein [Actinokineospora sp. NBRC 105648]|uniref:LutC/YkgG family protein n=1 Tax=Actinokineospora sp. NBRC 105648 TaxID=3032206 RepID=UPI0024A2FF7A|nr:LUD domain-containing protein [Actinokineospora sp. NBRC 105648]GLZ41010.1 lactate utilization protein C [Actinokineospora sp. NBRC 105648]